MIGDTWYRYIDREYNDGWAGPDRKIILVELTVVEETPKTVVLVRKGDARYFTLNYIGIEKKRVLKNARRRWAYPTKALALNSYKIRKDWQAGYARRMLDRAVACQAATALVLGLLS